jgi:hypothetical protein
MQDRKENFGESVGYSPLVYQLSAFVQHATAHNRLQGSGC